MKLEISLERKGKLSHIKQLVKKHFLAQNYILQKEENDLLTFKRGYLVRSWFFTNPSEWKTKVTVKISLQNQSYLIEANWRITTFTSINSFREEQYWEAELASFRNAILSEQIFEKKNFYLAKNNVFASSHHNFAQLEGVLIGFKLLILYLGQVKRIKFRAF